MKLPDLAEPIWSHAMNGFARDGSSSTAWPSEVGICSMEQGEIMTISPNYGKPQEWNRIWLMF